LENKNKSIAVIIVIKVKVKLSHYRPEQAHRFQNVKAPRFLDIGT
jgi:hypothetical protein